MAIEGEGQAPVDAESDDRFSYIVFILSAFVLTFSAGFGLAWGLGSSNPLVEKAYDGFTKVDELSKTCHRARGIAVVLRAQQI